MYRCHSCTDCQRGEPAGAQRAPDGYASEWEWPRRIGCIKTPAGPKIGDPAPDFSLPDLTGKQVNLSDFRGSKTLVLFWNLGCGFCQRILEDLKAWEAKPPKGAPKLLVVSTGTVEANAAMGLRSPVLLGQGFSAGRKFAANGTPMAVLVDEEGKIASEVAAVLVLAGIGQNQQQVPAQSR